jgi:hypothetical protein
MMLTPSLTGWRAQYDRFQRSYTRVTGPYRSSVEYDDDLHHFMQDCWHLKDWIKNDPTTGIGNSIETKVAVYKYLRIAADLANGSKHLNRHTHQEGAYVTSIGVTVHLGQDKPIDVECTVTLGDGTQIPVQQVVREAHSDWDSLLKQAELIP